MDIHGTYGYVICQRWTISISYFLWQFFLDIFHMVDTLAHVHGSSEDRGTSVFRTTSMQRCVIRYPLVMSNIAIEHDHL